MNRHALALSSLDLPPLHVFPDFFLGGAAIVHDRSLGWKVGNTVHDRFAADMYRSSFDARQRKKIRSPDIKVHSRQSMKAKYQSGLTGLRAPSCNHAFSTRLRPFSFSG